MGLQVLLPRPYLLHLARVRQHLVQLRLATVLRAWLLLLLPLGVQWPKGHHGLLLLLLQLLWVRQHAGVLLLLVGGDCRPTKVGHDSHRRLHLVVGPRHRHAWRQRAVGQHAAGNGRQRLSLRSRSKGVLLLGTAEVVHEGCLGGQVDRSLLRLLWQAIAKVQVAQPVGGLCHGWRSLPPQDLSWHSVLLLLLPAVLLLLAGAGAGRQRVLLPCSRRRLDPL
jgi:hypothetical protein